MSQLLNSLAIGSRSGEDAEELLQAYIATGPVMVLNHTPAAAVEQRPKGTGAGDHLIEPR